MRTIFCLLAAASIGWGALADVITMKDGRQISGRIEAGDSREIQIKVGDNAQKFGVDQIRSIQFGGEAAAASAQTFAPIPVPPTPPQSGVAEPAPPPLPTPPPVPPDAQTVTLPAGKEIAIRTIDEINSKTADEYKEYAASIDDAVVWNGLTVLPAHTKAILKANAIRKGGLKTAPSITMALAWVTINGQRVVVDADRLDSKGGSNKKKTVILSAAGAGGGAAIGSVFGPVGAGIGAVAGVTAGVIAAAVTRRGVEIKPETRFTYKLAGPLTINIAGGAH